MCPGLSEKCVAMCMFSQPHSALFKKTSTRIALFRDSVSGLTRTLNHIIIISSMKTRLCSRGNACSSRRVLLGCMCFLGRRFMERKKLYNLLQGKKHGVHVMHSKRDFTKKALSWVPHLSSRMLLHNQCGDRFNTSYNIDITHTYNSLWPLI